MILRAAYASRRRVLNAYSRTILKNQASPENGIKPRAIFSIHYRYFSTQKESEAKEKLVKGEKEEIHSKEESKSTPETKEAPAKAEDPVKENTLEQQPPSRESGFFRSKLLGYLIIFGGIGFVLNNSLEYRKESHPHVPTQRKKMQSNPALYLNEESFQQAKDHRLSQIRNSIEQELEQEYQLIPEGYNTRFLRRQQDLTGQVHQLLGLDKIKDPERYEEATKNIREVNHEIEEAFKGLDAQKSKIERQLETLDKLRNLIEGEINDLQQEFNKAETKVEEYREAHFQNLKAKSQSFLREFGKIKTESESAVLSYLNKVKDFIEEGQECIKDIELNIPEDLTNVDEDSRARYVRLKFMIKEYYRDHDSAATSYERLKEYFHNYKKGDFLTIERGTDQLAQIRALEDEKSILMAMIQEMKNEIESTAQDMDQRKKRIAKINYMSTSKKIDILQYYNEIDSLCAKMNRVRLVGGNISSDLMQVKDFSKGQDELLSTIIDDLLSNGQTSTDVITARKLETIFANNRHDYYWDCFQRKKTLLNLFGRTSYYLYTYLILDKFKFEKKYSIGHIVKDDSEVCRDIRLLNYIEEALAEGNIEEAHLFATQVSPKMADSLKEFIEQCELWIKFQLACDTLRDHSGNLVAQVF
ncbi:unnamed protein product [Moneuplotes crassus]|uniref:Uncharacterized protein n=1 Tax=Euplotes crassus TaxID=5936 RepID=A0AAD1U6I2_EUPCR|nr:unnamed protein product [Moneuplotes crassus]